ncbi:MAG: hypothetical protein HYU86_05360 [Chloroflexi bacterium]|nr:hypothetical protein [Chloroflexota bacterium]
MESIEELAMDLKGGDWEKEILDWVRQQAGEMARALLKKETTISWGGGEPGWRWRGSGSGGWLRCLGM